ncbi:hypothetical protein LOTGIDRAFT_164008 [Lottia gigantea]|uniref:C-type lectin domain-containing protein n=1 Tax=Lottia gigantea TaxID=225164 RepID=V4A1A6_LOTGI|nr:hypothetical protein LOTGIDRAFT_164008 [Lottia gigantea]ESO90427.1 hypothetical protein LOTGIDRAFT_164008 [Lottia gigantea]
MILKIDISVSLLLMLTVNLVNADYWRTTNFIIPITKQFVAKFRVDSRLRCFEQCSTHFSSLLVNIQDGDCFCLTSHPDSNWTGGEVTLISFMSRRSEQSDCISKGYTIYHALGVCIKYIASRKTWQEAKRHCNQDGGYLINLNTLEKYTASLNIMISEFQKPPDCISKEYTIYPELGNCIRYINTRKTWLDAERHCNQDGGYLINVDTEAKFNVSIDIALTTNQWHIYVGGFTTFWDAENTEYYWTRGSVLDRFWASDSNDMGGNSDVMLKQTQYNLPNGLYHQQPVA